MTYPTLEIIAKTIAGPNEHEHIGIEKLRELQDIRWSRLKSQEQAGYLRAARFVVQLFATWQSEPASRSTPQATGGFQTRDPVLREGDGTAPQPAPILPVDRNSVGDVLRIFRQFVLLNATRWEMGAGHHHPMWALVAQNVEGEENTRGPDWQFIQPTNKKLHSILVEEFVANGGQTDAH